MRPKLLHVLALLVLGLLACGQAQPLAQPALGLPIYLVGQPALRTYAVADLPAGWGWDVTKIQGELLPVGYDPVRPTNDPELWLVPCGQVIRGAPTNDWVKQINIVSVTGPVPISVSVFLDQDPATKKSVTWRLETWSVPGPWYIVVDCVSQPGKNGQSKVKRYTIVGAGYVPDDYVPFLW